MFEMDPPPTLLSKEAIASFFPESHVLNFELLDRGHSGARIYKVQTAKGLFCLRQSSKLSEEELKILKVASQEGLAPQLISFDQNANVVISAWVHIEKPLFGKDYLFHHGKKLMELLHKLHSLAADQVKKRIVLHDVQARLKNIDSQFFSPQEWLALRSISQLSWPDDTSSLCHNDIHPNNLLYDGQKLYLVDWTSAGISHPFYDVAFSACSEFMSPEEGLRFFYLYLGRHPSPKELSIFTNMRRIACAYFALLFHSLLTTKDATPPLKKEELRQFLSLRLRESEILKNYRSC